jgi:hypothetical protein
LQIMPSLPGAADAGATEATMVSVSAATTAPNHFFADEVLITNPC